MSQPVIIVPAAHGIRRAVPVKPTMMTAFPEKSHP